MTTRTLGFLKRKVAFKNSLELEPGRNSPRATVDSICAPSSEKTQQILQMRRWPWLRNHRGHCYFARGDLTGH
jgi:hypothetical protein